MTDDIGDLQTAIAEFKAALPGWWFTVGSCGVSRDASCGPDWAAGSDRSLLDAHDHGYHCDDFEPGSTLAGSLRDVTRQARDALGDGLARAMTAGLRPIADRINSELLNGVPGASLGGILSSPTAPTLAPTPANPPTAPRP